MAAVASMAASSLATRTDGGGGDDGYGSSATSIDASSSSSASGIDQYHLVNAPRMKPSDLDIPLSLEDIDTIQDFETTWNQFLMKHPELLSSSTKQRRDVLPKLQSDIHKTKASYEQVQNELQRQLFFFAQSKDKLENKYKSAMTQATSNQITIHNDLQKHLDTVAFRDARLSNQTIPWEHFMELLDTTVNGSNGTNTTTTMSVNNNRKHSIKPSAKSLFLVDRRPKQAKAVVDPVNGKGHAIPPSPNFFMTAAAATVGQQQPQRLLEETDPDVQLRAYRIDHALLKAQVKTLQAEVDQFEKNRESIEVIGKFLTEHNVWSLINANANNSNANQSVMGSTIKAPKQGSVASTTADITTNPTNIITNTGGRSESSTSLSRA